ncbi:putative START domain-containing protein 10-like [Cocos nucifera]|nr:putative START domain-containing protein 10-like [Cocos nucifera]
MPALQSNNSHKVMLLEMPNAPGKYLSTNGIYQFKDFAETSAKLSPDILFYEGSRSQIEYDDCFCPYKFYRRNSTGTFVVCEDMAMKLIDLGLAFTPMEEAIKDSEGSLKAEGILGNFPSSQSSQAFYVMRSVSEDSLRRYVSYASESCIQELLSASDSSWAGGGDGWKVLALENGVEISKRCSGSLHVFRSRWVLHSVSLQQFITVANAIDAAKVVAVASLPKEIAAGLQPKKNNAIRGLLLQSGWVVEKLENDSCMVTYVIQLDPAGWLPKCFVNRLNTKLVMIIENLKMLAQTCPMSTGAT